LFNHNFAQVLMGYRD